VNCQLGVGPWEKFHKRPQSDGTVAFESAAFPGAYLRMDAQGIGEFGSAAGAGTVNCQFGVGPWEKFLLLDPPFSAVKGQFAGGSAGSSTSEPVSTTSPAPSNPAQDAAVDRRAFRASDYDSDHPAVTDANYIYSPDYGSGTSTADLDFATTSSVGTSHDLNEEHRQALEEASSVESEGTSQDPDQSR
jgi:hypothetical protein